MEERLDFLLRERPMRYLDSVKNEMQGSFTTFRMTASQGAELGRAP